MKLSIIVPVYKVESYLRRCIDSILAQTYADFELILVDDGSPDGCPAICDEYKQRDARIVVVHKENGGLSDARNAGLEIAQGEYIAFVDSDDLIHPQMYELLFYFQEALLVDVVQGGMCHFYENEKLSFDEQTVENVVPICMEAEELLATYYPNNAYVFGPTVCNKIYKRYIFNDLRFPDRKYYEDSYIHLNIIQRCRRVAVVPIPLYYYLQRDGSIMHSTYTPLWFYSIRDLCRERVCFFRKKNMKEQVEYAVDDLVTRFSKDKFAVYFQHPEYKKGFREVEQGFRREFWAILKNSKICEMKKLLAVTLIVCPKVAWKIAKKYFPECIYPFMR